MKDLILLLVQLVGVVSFLGGIFALMNRLFGFSIGTKGNPLPADFRAAAMLFGIAAVCGLIFYLLGRKR
jgi:VIT1/CCC1 family predicted Fe2+/Mn2+ transporter